jgi:hypothetical protein
MEIGLVSGIGLFIIAQLKAGGSNGSGTVRIQNPFHLFQHLWFLLQDRCQIDNRAQ